jgi:hypothetical protein
MWSMLSAIRTSPLADEMIDAGELVEVMIEDSPRRYLAVPSFLRARARYDDRMRILGPLDPLLWDRDLVRHVFDFEYVWEVYKPAHQRRWGWYVCPLLHRNRGSRKASAPSCAPKRANCGAASSTAVDDDDFGIELFPVERDSVFAALRAGDIDRFCVTVPLFIARHFFDAALGLHVNLQVAAAGARDPVDHHRLRFVGREDVPQLDRFGLDDDTGFSAADADDRFFLVRGSDTAARTIVVRCAAGI